MHDYKQLKVYGKVKDFIVLLYQFTEKLPDTEKFGLVAQMRRAAVSILLNIAEGSGSDSQAEFKRFLRISLRSVYEVKTALEICLALKFCSQSTFKDLWAQLDEIAAMLSGLIKSIKTR